jgi:hypothetical protein
MGNVVSENRRFRVSVGPAAVRIIDWFNRNPALRLRIVDNAENRAAAGQLVRLGIISEAGDGYVLTSRLGAGSPSTQNNSDSTIQWDFSK